MTKLKLILRQLGVLLYGILSMLFDILIVYAAGFAIVALALIVLPIIIGYISTVLTLNTINAVKEIK